MNSFQLEIDEKKLTELVLEYLRSLTVVRLEPDDVEIQVMTKNNYRVKEWEKGAFRAKVSKQL